MNLTSFDPASTEMARQIVSPSGDVGRIVQSIRNGTPEGDMEAFATAFYYLGGNRDVIPHPTMMQMEVARILGVKDLPTQDPFVVTFRGYHDQAMIHGWPSTYCLYYAVARYFYEMGKRQGGADIVDAEVANG